MNGPIRKRKKRSPCLPWFLGICSIFFVLLFFVFNYFYGLLGQFNSNQFVSDPARPVVSLDFGKRINILIIGVDAPSLKESARSDVLMVASYYAKENNLKMLSVPRDTMVNPQGLGVCKINACNNPAFNFKFGTPFLIETVEELLGIKINAYVKTNFRGFSDIIDKLGGIDLNVEKDMLYYDPIDKFKIDLKKGYQHLNGSMALQYVRYRSDLADFVLVDGKPMGRVARQANFMKAILKEASSPKNWFKLGQVMQAATDAIETDLTPSMMIRLATKIKDVGPDGIKVLGFPGTDQYVNKISYVIPNKVEIEKLVSENFLAGSDPIKPNP